MAAQFSWRIEHQRPAVGRPLVEVGVNAEGGRAPQEWHGIVPTLVPEHVLEFRAEILVIRHLTGFGPRDQAIANHRRHDEIPCHRHVITGRTAFQLRQHLIIAVVGVDRRFDAVSLTEEFDHIGAEVIAKDINVQLAIG